MYTTCSKYIDYDIIFIYVLAIYQCMHLYFLAYTIMYMYSYDTHVNYTILVVTIDVYNTLYCYCFSVFHRTVWTPSQLLLYLYTSNQNSFNPTLFFYKPHNFCCTCIYTLSITIHSIPHCCSTNIFESKFFNDVDLSLNWF